MAFSIKIKEFILRNLINILISLLTNFVGIGVVTVVARPGNTNSVLYDFVRLARGAIRRCCTCALEGTRIVTGFAYILCIILVILYRAFVDAFTVQKIKA